jgi:hypothetical protein
LKEKESEFKQERTKFLDLIKDFQEEIKNLKSNKKKVEFRDPVEKIKEISGKDKDFEKLKL